MKLVEKESRSQRELLLPMINVVFLLLIFLMLMGRITERPDIDIKPALSTSAEEETGLLTLYANAEGILQFRSQVGYENVLLAVQEEFTSTTSSHNKHEIAIRADAQADLSKILRLAKDIAKLTEGSIKLEVLTQ